MIAIIFKDLLDIQANLPETRPFFICPLLEMFIVLVIYNFAFIARKIGDRFSLSNR